MEVTLTLCDFAEAVNGKLYVMGGGWNILFAPGQPVTMSVAAVHRGAVGSDEPVARAQPRTAEPTDAAPAVEIEEQTVEVTGEFELGRPPGIKPGSSAERAVRLDVCRTRTRPRWLRVEADDRRRARRESAIRRGAPTRLHGRVTP